MKRFLSTTAVLLTMSGAAYADAHTNGFGTVAANEGDFFASDLIGMRIYNSEMEFEADARIADGAEQEWDDIGEINDLIVTKDGKVSAVILGVGGFLGLGERDVSVSMDAIKVLREEGDSDDRFLVVRTSKEELEQAPEFDRDMDGEMEAEVENAAAKTEENTEEVTAEATEEVKEADTEMADNDKMEREMLPRPAMTRDGYEEAGMETVAKLSSDELDGAYVYGANDETVGEIDKLLMSDDGKVTEVVINVGGFLGLGEKPVAVTFDELQVLKNKDGDDYRIYIDSTEERLEAQPEYKD